MNILKRLHHRPPYLLINEVTHHNPMNLTCMSVTNGEEFFLKGQFPGTPIVPGAIMQEMTTQAAGLLITEHYSPVPDYDSEKTKGWALGVLRAVHNAKYKRFARPGEKLEIKVELLDHLDHSFRFKGKIEIQGETVMKNEFTLINISEDKLKGL